MTTNSARLRLVAAGKEARAFARARAWFDIRDKALSQNP
jgi:hypothetical protein